MTTDQLTGRALDEAAARAMGWRILHGMWHRPGEGLPAPLWGFDAWPEPTVDEMVVHLTTRGKHGSQLIVSAIPGEVGCELVMGDCSEEMGQTFFYGPSEVTAFGTDLREALARLVVAVKQREESTDGK